MKKKTLKPMSPQAARTHKDICSLRRDNLSSAHGWIIIDEVTVTVAQQSPGEEAKALVTLPRREFERLAKWYFRPQTRVVRS